MLQGALNKLKFDKSNATMETVDAPPSSGPVTVANPSAGGRVGGGRPVGDEDDI
jgi:hypothetical protein